MADQGQMCIDNDIVELLTWTQRQHVDRRYDRTVLDGISNRNNTDTLIVALNGFKVLRI